MAPKKTIADKTPPEKNPRANTDTKIVIYYMEVAKLYMVIFILLYILSLIGLAIISMINP